MGVGEGGQFLRLMRDQSIPYSFFHMEKPGLSKMNLEKLNITNTNDLNGNMSMHDTTRHKQYSQLMIEMRKHLMLNGCDHVEQEFFKMYDLTAVYLIKRHSAILEKTNSGVGDILF